MPRYIIAPKRRHILTQADLSKPVSFSAESRQKILTEAHELRKKHSFFKSLQNWFLGKEDIVKRVSDGSPVEQVTGTYVVDMDDSQVENLRDTVADVEVVPDRLMTLIEPPSKRVIDTEKPKTSDLWHLHKIGLTKAARAEIKTSGEGVTVAVLDTGIQGDHPELQHLEIPMTTFDVDTWNFTTSSHSIDTGGHGTHVAGLIAGKNVGVAPNARLLSGVMMPNGTGMLSDFILAMEWAANIPEVSIVNVSAGFPGYVDGMEDIVDTMRSVGVLPVIATGNEGRNQTRSPGNYRPVLSVGACDKHGQVSGFSSSGELAASSREIYKVPDLVAPGENVVSCTMDGSYQAWSGTSMATPIVSGLAALVISKYNTISIDDLTEALLENCTKLRGVTPERQGAGRPNLNMLKKKKKKKKKKAARRKTK